LIGLTVQLELLKRLSSVQVDPLVEALREFHLGSPTGAARLQSLLAPAQSPSESAAATPAPVRPAMEPAKSVDYEAARRHFTDHARRLREQADLAERLLEGFVRRQSAAPPTSLQHEVTVTGERGSTTGASFVVVNRDEQPIDVTFHVDDRQRSVEAAAVARSLAFDPPAPRLMPGQEAVVQLSLSLRDYQAAQDLIEMGVDVRNENRLLVRLWVRVRVVEQETNDGSPIG
jgi:hypothetical protein